MTKTKASAIPSCNTNISTYILWVQLIGGPKRGIFQVASDRLTACRLELAVDFAIEGTVYNH